MISNLELFYLFIFVLGFREIFWLITDNRPFKKRFHNGLAYWFIFFLGNGILFWQYLIIINSSQSISGLDLFAIIPGFITMIFGLYFAVWAKVEMGQYWGMPATVDTKKQTKVVTGGPFKYSRNPIYVGLFFLFFGGFLMMRSPFILVPFLLIFKQSFDIKKEEKNLEKRFGEEYLSYKRKTPRFLFTL